MSVITISREHGSRGAAIGARVAEQLGWRYVDDDLVLLVAHRAGIEDREVRAYDQEGFSRLRAFAHDCAAMLESLGPPPLAQTTGMPDEMQLPVNLERFYSARYLKHFYRVDWNDPLLYHLTLNTAALREDEAVRLILSAAPTEDEGPISGSPGH